MLDCNVPLQMAAVAPVSASAVQDAVQNAEVTLMDFNETTVHIKLSSMSLPLPARKDMDNGGYNGVPLLISLLLAGGHIDTFWQLTSLSVSDLLKMGYPKQAFDWLCRELAYYAQDCVGISVVANIGISDVEKVGISDWAKGGVGIGAATTATALLATKYDSLDFFKHISARQCLMEVVCECGASVRRVRKVVGRVFGGSGDATLASATDAPKAAVLKTAWCSVYPAAVCCTHPNPLLTRPSVCCLHAASRNSCLPESLVALC
jgi:hypothetical protein